MHKHLRSYEAVFPTTQTSTSNSRTIHTMSRDGCIKGNIVTFHIAISLVTGIGGIFALSKAASITQCIPPMVLVPGVTYPALGGWSTGAYCKGLIGTLFVISGLSGLMAGCLICFSRNIGMVFINFFLSLLFGLFASLSATFVSIYKDVWCNNLEQQMSFHLGTPYRNCSDAAITYGAGFHDSLEALTYVKFGCFVLASLTFILILLYGIGIRTFGVRRFNYSDETTPLIISGVKPEDMNIQND